MNSHSISPSYPSFSTCSEVPFNNSLPPSPPHRISSPLLGIGSLLGITTFMNLWQGNNDIFAAGFGLFLFNALVTQLKYFVDWVWKLVTDKITYTITVKGKDECYTWLITWFAAQSYMATAHTMNARAGDTAKYDVLGSATGRTYSVEFLPSNGHHFISYKGKLVSFQMNADSPSLSSDSGSLSIATDETMTITLYNSRENLLRDLVHEAMAMAENRHKDKTKIYVVSYGRWAEGVAKDKRVAGSVVLDPAVKCTLESDVRFFLDNKEWYVQRGIPYRRGYLLHGPPGTGKTSTILAIAGQFNFDLCTISLASTMDDMTLLSLISKLPKKTLLVLEDVDSVFVKRQSESGSDRLSFSGLLNALDGIASTDGRILFMTTNHVEKLSPALIRPGRVDRKFLFDFASHAQLSTMFLQFYDSDENDEVLRVLVEKIEERKVTTAQLQGWFILHNNDPQALVTDVDRFVAEAISDNSKTDNVDDVGDPKKESEDGRNDKEVQTDLDN